MRKISFTYLLAIPEKNFQNLVFHFWRWGTIFDQLPFSYSGEWSESRERGTAPPLRPPLSSLLSRASRASTFHDIPQRESLLAG